MVQLVPFFNTWLHLSTPIGRISWRPYRPSKMLVRSTFPSNTQPQRVFGICTTIPVGDIPPMQSISMAMMPLPMKSRTISGGKSVLLRLLLFVEPLQSFSLDTHHSHHCLLYPLRLPNTPERSIQHHNWISDYIHDILGVVVGSALLQVRWPPTLRLCERLSARAADPACFHGPCRTNLGCKRRGGAAKCTELARGRAAARGRCNGGGRE